MGIEKGHEYGMSEEDFSGKGYKIDIKNCPRIPIFTRTFNTSTNKEYIHVYVSQSQTFKTLTDRLFHFYFIILHILFFFFFVL